MEDIEKMLNALDTHLKSDIEMLPTSSPQSCVGVFALVRLLLFLSGARVENFIRTCGKQLFDMMGHPMLFSLLVTCREEVKIFAVKRDVSQTGKTNSVNQKLQLLDKWSKAFKTSLHSLEQHGTFGELNADEDTRAPAELQLSKLSTMIIGEFEETFAELSKIRN